MIALLVIYKFSNEASLTVRDILYRSLQIRYVSRLKHWKSFSKLAE